MFPYVLTIPVVKVVDGGICILQLVTGFLDPALCRSTPDKEQRVASLDLFSLSGEMVGVPISWLGPFYRTSFRVVVICS
jgi:hypothetical protein